MNGKRDKGQGPRNPWVRKTDAEEVEEAAATPEPELPPSPWSLEVPPRPTSPWDAPDAGTTPAGPAADQAGSPDAGDASTAGAGGWGEPGAGGPAPGAAGSAPSTWGDAGTPAGGPAAGGQGPGSSFGTGSPSLRRPEPVKKGFKLPSVAIPIAAGLAVVVLVAVALTLLTGGDDKADPGPAQTPSTTPTPTATYTPPANAIPVEFGVSVVPAPGWSVLAKETKGKQLVTYAPNGEPRAFFWVRQKQNVTANAFALGIVEGETDKEIAQLGNVRNLPCPKDVLVECVAISYTSTPAKGVSVKGEVEVYRRKDGLVTALDYRSRSDYAPTADAAVVPMKQSVIDSL
ncbi:hypothetical protein [Kribbella catacumbae]|uniref:hypothetical protein n=1 Tax=Kribbella catacumbae TaxID=460086 RepID=UPI0012F8B59C|nr:hypothetical protein [Kribbella catacumbae]